MQGDFDRWNPRPGCALVRLDALPGASAGGVLFTETQQRNPDNILADTGEVLAVGEPYVNRKGVRVTAPFKKGDRVCFRSKRETRSGPESFQEYFIEATETHVLLTWDRVLGTLEEAP